MKIKMFETFSGIGAQHKALSNLKKNNVLDFEVVGTSDWDVYSVQSYAAIHYPNVNINIKKIRLNDLIFFLSSNSFSKNGKSQISINQKLWSDFLNSNYKILQSQFIEHEREREREINI